MGFLDSVTKFFEHPIDSVSSFGSSVEHEISKPIKAVENVGSDVISGIENAGWTVVHGVETGFNKVEGGLTEGFNFVEGGLETGFNKVEGGFATLGTDIKDLAVGAEQDVMKVVDVIDTGAKYAFNEAETIVEGVYDFTKPFVMILYQVGRFVGQNPNIVLFGGASFIAFKYINEGRKLTKLL
jgi:phage-related protein